MVRAVNEISLRFREKPAGMLKRGKLCGCWKSFNGGWARFIHTDVGFYR